MKGRIITYHGEGEGKTSAALGHAVRAAGHGKKVAVIQFMKGRTDTGEYRFFKDCGHENIEVHSAGARGFLRDGENRELHVEKVEEGLVLAHDILKGQGHDLLVMDEVLYALKFGLTEPRRVLELLDSRGKTHVILTGREPPEEILDASDIITRFTLGRHHYDEDHETIEGLDW